MRVPTQTFFNRSIGSVMSHQAKLNEQNTYIAAQKKVITASDDPVAFSTIQRLKQDLSMTTTLKKNSDLAENSNALEETALDQGENLMQRARELLVTSGNGTYDAKAREAVAKELEQIRKELIGVANTRDANSQYIFAGYKVDTQPFQVNEFGSVDYHGDDGIRNYQIGNSVQVAGNDPGSSIFVNIPTGNGTFLATANAANKGSGVIDEGTVVDPVLFNSFAGETYTVSFNEPAPGADMEYRVYGMKPGTVTGNATVKIAAIDSKDPNFATVAPSAIYPDTTGPNGNNVAVLFNESPVGSGLYDVTVNGVTAVPQYNTADTNAQKVGINGISLEIDGLPKTGDGYTLTQYVGATPYQSEQDIEFNGIKTQVKGTPLDQDNLSLEPSGQQDLFATLQQAIDALRTPGENDTVEAKRDMSLNAAKLQLDNAFNVVKLTRADVGARLNTIDSQREASADYELASKKVLSQLEDLDLQKAISDFQLEKTTLEVSQKMFSMVQDLNLFKYM